MQPSARRAEGEGAAGTAGAGNGRWRRKDAASVENNITAKGVLAVLLALRETSCPVRLLDLSCLNNGAR